MRIRNYLAFHSEHLSLYLKIKQKRYDAHKSDKGSSDIDINSQKEKIVAIQSHHT